MKKPEEIKNFEAKKELAYVAFGKVSYEGCHKIAAKALAYIQQLEIRNGAMEKALDEVLVLNKKQASIIQSLNSNNSQVKKALQDNGFQTLEELLQAYSQVKRERDAAVADLNCNWKCAICKRFTKPIDKCPHYGECGLGYRNFEWRGSEDEGAKKCEGK